MPAAIRWKLLVLWLKGPANWLFAMAAPTKAEAEMGQPARYQLHGSLHGVAHAASKLAQRSVDPRSRELPTESRNYVRLMPS